MNRIFLTVALSGVLFISIGFAQPVSSAKRIIDRVSPSIVMVTRPLADDKLSICTGFVVNSSQKQVLTAKHCIVGDVLDDYNTVFVDGLPATIAKANESLALLVVPNLKKPGMAIEKYPVMIGDIVYAMGFGEGMPTILLRPIVWVYHKDGRFQDAIIVDGIFIRGMSGGPVISQGGNIVGMVQRGDNVMGYASGPGAIRAFLK